MDRRNIARTLNKLKERNIITVSGNKHKLIYSFQKDYDSWQTLSAETTNGTLSAETMKEPQTLSGETMKALSAETTKETQVPKPNVVCIDNSALSVETTQTLSTETNTKTKNILLKQYAKGELLFSDKEKHLLEILKRCPAIKPGDAWKLPELLSDYPDLNYELEFKKFVEWWPGPKKRKKPWAVLRNWLERAQKEKSSGKSRDLPTHYTEPPDYGDD